MNLFELIASSQMYLCMHITHQRQIYAKILSFPCCTGYGAKCQEKLTQMQKDLSFEFRLRKKSNHFQYSIIARFSKLDMFSFSAGPISRFPSCVEYTEIDGFIDQRESISDTVNGYIQSLSVEQSIDLV